MSETEQKKWRFTTYATGPDTCTTIRRECGEKRRFTIQLVNTGRIGLECDDWRIDEKGLVFYSSKMAESIYFTVLFVAPGQYRSFYELADGDDWPKCVEYILSEEGRGLVKNANTDRTRAP